MRRQLVSLCYAILFLLCCSCPSFALIRGDKGNKPIADPGWPSGSETVFNTPNRIAYWEGPPYGGGQWHSECQGNTVAFNEVLKAFGKIVADKKRLVIQDGVGTSFWLDPNQEQKGAPQVEVDWVFVIWQTERWNMQKNFPPGLSALRTEKDKEAPVPEITLYTGGGIVWKDVVVPDGIEVVDNRLESHGYSKKDGRVLEGKILDAQTGAPVAATVRSEQINPKAAGGYDYQSLGTVKTDDQGKWVFKNIGQEWRRFVVEAESYAPRLITYTKYSPEPGWQSIETKLAKSASVRGRVTDSSGKPLAKVAVSFRDVALKGIVPYEIPIENDTLTDDQGRFEIQTVAGGSGRVWIHLQGYCREGLGLETTAPASDIELQMSQAASLKIQVVFGKKPNEGGYIVSLKPEGGEKIGSWGGSANIDAENKAVFENVPPGRYIVVGRPNPGSDSEQTSDLLVVLEGGKETAVEIKAK